MDARDLAKSLMQYGFVLNDSSTKKQRTTTVLLDGSTYFIFWYPRIRVVKLGTKETWEADKIVQ